MIPDTTKKPKQLNLTKPN